MPTYCVGVRPPAEPSTNTGAAVTSTLHTTVKILGSTRRQGGREAAHMLPWVSLTRTPKVMFPAGRKSTDSNRSCTTRVSAVAVGTSTAQARPPPHPGLGADEDLAAVADGVEEAVGEGRCARSVPFTTDANLRCRCQALCSRHAVGGWPTSGSKNMAAIRETLLLAPVLKACGLPVALCGSELRRAVPQDDANTHVALMAVSLGLMVGRGRTYTFLKA